jgi:hypothetical protein
MSYVTAGLVAFITLLGGFYGGYRYELAKAPAPTSNTPTISSNVAGNGTRTGNGGGAGGAGGAFIGRGGAGTITNLTATGFTLHSPNGTDTKVTFGSSTTVRKTVDGSLSDLSNNLTVAVGGPRDASGNITATTITIVPAGIASPTAGG